ncbi:MAG: hypothetical protein DRJ39_03275 [Thermoprotei archaeon]|nr:MAG: hypothetical protein DRJ39_03275 [Thermoprotei archaeon]
MNIKEKENNSSKDLLTQGESILKKLVMKSRGSIEYAMVVSPEGLSLFHFLPRDVDPDSLSAATIAMVGALMSALGILGKSNYSRLDVELGDGSHIIFSPLNDYVLVISTSKSPNLGLIYLMIDHFVEKLSQLIKEKL